MQPHNAGKFAPISFLRGSVEELRKVTWPTKKQATSMTILVIVISLLIAAFIAVLDFGLTAGYEKLLKTTRSNGSSNTSDTIDVGGTPITIPSSGENPIPITIPSGAGDTVAPAEAPAPTDTPTN